MIIKRVQEEVKEIKLSKRKVSRLSKRSMVPPSPAELNVYDPLLSKQSYDNYDNSSPYGTEGSSNKSDAGATSGSEGSSN